MIKKVLLTATVQSHICQFHKPLVKVLHAHGCEVHVAARDNLAEKNGLKLDFVEKVYDIPFARSPKSSDNIKAYKELKKILAEEQYDVIHCNTPMGGIVTRLAARNARKVGTKVIYTAHGFHFYQGGPKKSWLVFYPIEKAMAKLTDVLITITKEDYELASKKFKTDVRHIHGVGVNEEKYLSVSPESNQAFRKEMGYDKHKVILCTGELNANKNQATLIRAMKQIVETHPDVLLLLAGNGPKEAELQQEIQNLGLESYIKLLGYHTDLEKYANACDIVASVSFREGMPLNIMEAMVCGKPIIASYNRGHRELVQNGETGLLVKADDVQELSNKLVQLLEDEELCKYFSENAMESVQPYLMKNVKKELEEIYF